MDSENADFDESANDVGGVGDTLRPMEALDPDDVRNDDGDEVVDPPDQWAEADRVVDPEEGETLDEKLAAEVPDTAAVPPPGDSASGDTAEVPDDELDRIDPERHGRDEGQIDGTPEDGESLFPVVE